VASAALVTAILVASLPFRALVDSEPALAPAGAARPSSTLPIPRESARVLARARSLLEAGQRHEALAMLRTIASTDPRRADADALTSAIQRDLLAAAGPAEVRR
jgi:hypothetical protein